MLAAALRVNHHLAELNITYNSIGDEGARYIGEALQANDTLAVLNLEDNGITAKGVESICAALHLNVALSSIDLGDNAIGERGADFVCHMLRINHTLTALFLSGTSPTPVGAAKICMQLSERHTMTQLGLSFFDFSEECVPHICRALAANPLQLLVLRGNALGDGDARMLTTALVENCTLRHLDLRCGNTFTDVGVAYLASAVSFHPSLQSLLICNRNSETGKAMIADAIAKRRRFRRKTATSLLLGNHWRAGANSSLQAVPTDILRTLTRLVFKAMAVPEVMYCNEGTQLAAGCCCAKVPTLYI
eukprot:TRINITY_DN4846_c0_g1_i5.p1 TRINITY_DN4846_c0_g1~~TRINITY_DN4846_c0_g1_i5.p1  ORF type:complete len:305 (-),score=58.34 TRINITY_DN4846_c0_g1_i5:58-972(-)